jgi:hypothetical protein
MAAGEHVAAKHTAKNNDCANNEEHFAALFRSCLFIYSQRVFCPNAFSDKAILP